MCVCVRVYVRAHGSFCAKQGYGIQPRPAKGERELLLRLCTVQFSWRASPRCVCVCVGCWCAAECVCRGGGLVWTEWTDNLLSHQRYSAGGRDGTRGLHRSPSCLLDGNLFVSRSLPTHTPSLAGVFGYDFALHSYRHTCCMTRLCNAGDYSLRTETRRSASLDLSPPSYHLHLSSSSRSSDTRCSLAQNVSPGRFHLEKKKTPNT